MEEDVVSVVFVLCSVCAHLLLCQLVHPLHDARGLAGQVEVALGRLVLHVLPEVRAEDVLVEGGVVVVRPERGDDVLDGEVALGLLPSGERPRAGVRNVVQLQQPLNELLGLESIRRKREIHQVRVVEGQLIHRWQKRGHERLQPNVIHRIHTGKQNHIEKIRHTNRSQDHQRNRKPRLLRLMQKLLKQSLHFK